MSDKYKMDLPKLTAPYSPPPLPQGKRVEVHHQPINIIQRTSNSSPGSVSEGIGGIILLLLIGLIYGTYRLVANFIQTLSSWPSLSPPYKEVACFYYFTLIMPFRLFSWLFGRFVALFSFIWTSLTDHGLTSYPNLNIVVAIVAELLIVSIVAFSIWQSMRLLFRVWRRYLSDKRTQALVLASSTLLAPAIFLFIWTFFAWLFQSSAPPNLSLASIESYRAPPYQYSQLLEAELRDPYDYMLEYQKPVPPTLTDVLICDICRIITVDLKVKKEPKQISEENVEQAMTIYLQRGSASIGGYRPWTHMHFIRGLTDQQRSSIAKEIVAYIAINGIRDVVTVRTRPTANFNAPVNQNKSSVKESGDGNSINPNKRNASVLTANQTRKSTPVVEKWDDLKEFGGANSEMDHRKKKERLQKKQQNQNEQPKFEWPPS